MMTFKEFYLQSSKRAKAPPRAPTRCKSPKRRDEILDRLVKLKAAKRRSAQLRLGTGMSGITR